MEIELLAITLMILAREAASHLREVERAPKKPARWAASWTLSEKGEQLCRH